MSKYIIDLNRWSQIESLPIVFNSSSFKDGLSLSARIIYVTTGEISDSPEKDLISPAIHGCLLALGLLPDDLYQSLGTLELAQRIISADTSDKAEEQRMFLCIDHAVRTYAVDILRDQDFDEQADILAALSPIINKETIQIAIPPTYKAANIVEHPTVYAAVNALKYADNALNGTSWQLRPIEPYSNNIVAAVTESMISAVSTDWDFAFQLFDKVLSCTTERTENQ